MSIQAVVDNYVNGNITDAKAGARRHSWRNLFWYLRDSGMTEREAKQMADKLKPKKEQNQ